MNRDFLQDIIIVGSLLVARCGDILDYSIPNLLKWCDWVLLMVDNEDEHTMSIVEKYKTKYPDRIRVSHTGFPRATKEQEESHRGLFHRFKPLQGPIRETVFQYMRDVVASGEKVDILVWPDSDEIFSNNFKKLLQEFWESDKKGLTMKPVDVFGDMSIIHNRSMTGHTRVFKFFPELTAVPYRTACNHRPLTRADRMGDNRTLIHLASLTPTKRSWRDKHWKPNNKDSQALWKLPKPVYELNPEEIREILHREPDMTIEEYLRGGDKRQPVGVENAAKALFEATEMLSKMGVRSCLAFGTCLGLVRDKKLIKWDWDVDLIIWGEDLHNFNPSKVAENGFTELKIKQDLPRVKTEDGVESPDLFVRTISFKKYGVRVDLDPAYLSEDDTSRIILKGRKRQKFCAKHPREWFDNVGYIEYKGKQYATPAPVTDYLASNYGPTWNIPAYGPTQWSERPCMSQSYACKKI